jgi:hypothetical protein
MSATAKGVAERGRIERISVIFFKILLPPAAASWKATISCSGARRQGAPGPLLKPWENAEAFQVVYRKRRRSGRFSLSIRLAGESMFSGVPKKHVAKQSINSDF